MAEEETEMIRECPSCGNLGLQEKYRVQDIFYRVSDQFFVYSQCLKCELLFLSTRARAQFVGRYYPESYSPYRNVAQASLPKNYQWLQILFLPVRVLNKLASLLYFPSYNKKFNRISNPPEGSRVVLDFGCGNDLFLNAQRKEGVKTIGMDFSPGVVENIKESGHVGVLYNREAAWDAIEDDSVDFIRMSHVAEHLYDPRNVFQQLHRKLRKGGLLHVIVPNPKGISAKLYNHYALAIADAPRHTMLYPIDVLRKMLAEHGLHTETSLQEFVVKDVIRSQYIKKHYKTVDAKSLAMSLNDYAWNVMLIVPMMLCAKFSFSDRYHLLVKKK